MVGMGLSDVEALARARGGDTEAFRELVERYSALVFRVAYRLTGNEHDAEDVVQETFLRAYKRLHAFEDRSGLGSWLYKIAANCGYDVLRARRRRSRHFEEGVDEATGEGQPASAEPLPDRLVFGAEVRRRVEATLKQLSPAERTAFVLRHFEGRSVEEIGLALDLDRSATKHSIFRAVQKMRRALSSLQGTPA